MWHVSVCHRVGQYNRNTGRLADSYIESLTACVKKKSAYFAARGAVGVGSEAGVQTRVQSAGSMADEATEHVYVGNMPSRPANVKWQIELNY